MANEGKKSSLASLLLLAASVAGAVWLFSKIKERGGLSYAANPLRRITKPLSEEEYVQGFYTQYLPPAFPPDPQALEPYHSQSLQQVIRWTNTRMTELPPASRQGALQGLLDSFPNDHILPSEKRALLGIPSMSENERTSFAQNAARQFYQQDILAKQGVPRSTGSIFPGGSSEENLAISQAGTVYGPRSFGFGGVFAGF